MLHLCRRSEQCKKVRRGSPEYQNDGKPLSGWGEFTTRYLPKLSVLHASDIGHFSFIFILPAIYCMHAQRTWLQCAYNRPLPKKLTKQLVFYWLIQKVELDIFLWPSACAVVFRYAWRSNFTTGCSMTLCLCQICLHQVSVHTDVRLYVADSNVGRNAAQIPLSAHLHCIL